MAEKFNIEETEQYFGPLYPYVMDDEITDIDINTFQATGDDSFIWLTNSKNIRYKEPCSFSENFIEQFTKRVANTVSRSFHKQSPILEAETDTLRITIVHESVSVSGRSISIRKSLPYVRLTEENMVESGYCSERVLALLKNCVKARLNIVFCGEPAAGKTECAKFFSKFIPENERVITIEDTLEWHYHEVNPGKDCVELKVNRILNYTEAIRTCLRLNPKWIMLSETRSKEVVYLLECFSTGVRGMTTLHSDDVRNIPDRMLNMAGGERDITNMENDIYNFIDVGVLLNRKEEKDENGKHVIRRYIEQVCFYDRSDGKNEIYMVVENGDLIEEVLPESILHRMKKAGVLYPFSYMEEGVWNEIKGDTPITLKGGTYRGRKAAIG
ncbi:MAG: CpaF/VirB11 family protein [Lachnospiraceae bacterium]|nr:CpaF/VirB11 family protein [Lachnospiraceae bacterium]